MGQLPVEGLCQQRAHRNRELQVGEGQMGGEMAQAGVLLGSDWMKYQTEFYFELK